MLEQILEIVEKFNFFSSKSFLETLRYKKSVNFLFLQLSIQKVKDKVDVKRGT